MNRFTCLVVENDVVGVNVVVAEDPAFFESDVPDMAVGKLLGGRLPSNFANEDYENAEAPVWCHMLVAGTPVMKNASGMCDAMGSGATSCKTGRFVTKSFGEVFGF